MLPELKEWVKLGAKFIIIKRLEIQKRLENYAREKELDMPDAKKATTVIVDKLTEEKIVGLITALEDEKTT